MKRACSCCGIALYTDAEARLIAAAPDLLAVLRDELDAIRIWRKALIHTHKDVRDGIDISETKILIAIAKAEGAR